MSDSLDRAEAHLRQYASLDRFWIYRTPSTQPGVINYADSLGRAWTLMEDDEPLLEECLRLLESSGCPVFGDASEMRVHAERFAPGREGKGHALYP